MMTATAMAKNVLDGHCVSQRVSPLKLVFVSRAFPSAMPVCSPRLLYRRLQDGGITVLDESQHLICLGPPRQLEIGYQGAYLRSLRLVLTLRASPSATPVCSPRSLSSKLQKRAGISVSRGESNCL